MRYDSAPQGYNKLAMTTSSHRFETSEFSTAPVLRECVAKAVRRYLTQAGDEVAEDLYRLVMREVEGPLFQEVLKHFDGNLTQAAATLGISRATLRKKLEDLS